MYRQDSLEILEANRQQDLERRFQMVMRMVRQETKGSRPDLEEKARQMYFVNNDKTQIAENTVEPRYIEKTEIDEVTAPKTTVVANTKSVTPPKQVVDKVAFTERNSEPRSRPEASNNNPETRTRPEVVKTKLKQMHLLLKQNATR